MKMTNTKAKDLLNILKNINHNAEIITALSLGMAALENSNKYCWHDLRKDPNDLPNKKGFYLVYVKGFDCAYVTTIWDGYAWWGYEVVAWKEIVSFEE